MALPLSRAVVRSWKFSVPRSALAGKVRARPVAATVWAVAAVDAAPPSSARHARVASQAPRVRVDAKVRVLQRFMVYIQGLKRKF